MARIVRGFFLMVLGLLLLAAIGYIVVQLSRLAVLGLASLDSNIKVAIIAAAATVVVSVLSIVLAKLYESKALIQKEHRDKKIPVYEDLIGFVLRYLMSGTAGGPPSQDDMRAFMSEFTKRATVWGADEVLAAWVKWRRVLNDESAMEAEPMKIMLLYEDLLFAIRRDLGHRNSGLRRGDLLALFINDIDRYLPGTSR